MKENPKSFFMNHLLQIEFILFAIFAVGLVLSAFKIIGAVYIIALALAVFSIIYLIMTILIVQVKNMEKVSRLISSISYFSISVLVTSIFIKLVSLKEKDFIIHTGMLLVLTMIIIIQIRKFRLGVLSGSITFLLYRLMVFWIVGLFVSYILPLTM